MAADLPTVASLLVMRDRRVGAVGKHFSESLTVIIDVYIEPGKTLLGRHLPFGVCKHSDWGVSSIQAAGFQGADFTACTGCRAHTLIGHFVRLTFIPLCRLATVVSGSMGNA